MLTLCHKIRPNLWVKVLEKRGAMPDQEKIRNIYFSKIEKLSGRKNTLKIVELGCGTGVVTRALESHFSDAKVTGIDPQGPFIEYARNKGPDTIKYVVGSADDLPFKDSSHDCVIFHTTLSHLPVNIRNKALMETHRILKPNGP
eukprot:UN03570